MNQLNAVNWNETNQTEDIQFIDWISFRQLVSFHWLIKAEITETAKKTSTEWINEVAVWIGMAARKMERIIYEVNWMSANGQAGMNDTEIT